MPKITLLPEGRSLWAQPGQTLQQVLAAQGLADAPCGGQGICGKCAVVADGRRVLACRTPVTEDMTLELPDTGIRGDDPRPGSRIAFDLGTTTVVCFLVARDGTILSRASVANPQQGFGADVVSRIRCANAGHLQTLTGLIRSTMAALIGRVCATPEALEIISVVGNPAMQQLFLGLPTENLARLPFAPVLTRGRMDPAGEIFPDCPRAKVITVPDISGFVGADTVAGILATGLHRQEELTLLVDIGTNGEMALGNRDGLLACSTAAGPALEGAGILFGMRAEPGAIHRVVLHRGKLLCSVLGDGPARGICGSGLVDALAGALDLGLVDHRGRLLTPDKKIHLTDTVYLTQEDIRQVQLAKGAIAAGIRLMAAHRSIPLEAIGRVVLAGAFGSHLEPRSACRIGLLPPELSGRITAAGNAAGQGAIALAADPSGLAEAEAVAREAEYLELGSLPAFPRTFAKAMELPQDWVSAAKALGFDQAATFDPAILKPAEAVRDMCAADKCRTYGKNWSCPPHCGTLAQCAVRMAGYRRGILVQTVGQLRKTIDSRGYREAESRHLENFSRLRAAVRRLHPDALCLGSGGCRVCESCAWPEPCRNPAEAISSMEAYGLFVTQVCRDAGLAYHHGEKTITYTACILL